MKTYLMMVLMIASASRGLGQTPAAEDAILGVWKAQEKTLTVEIYKTGQEYRARVISFTDHHSTVPSTERTDGHNPDASKRSRKVIGIDVLTGLRYKASTGEWEDGQIYDVSSGNSYSAAATLTNGILAVRAYKGISLIGKTLHFRR